MQAFRFESFETRCEHEGLRDAWLATRDFTARTQWNGFHAECGLCRRQTAFSLRSDPANPDFREGLICNKCSCNARIRSALRLLLDWLPPSRQAENPRGRLLRFFRRPPSSGHSNVYVTEQATPTFAWMQHNLGATLHGSEFEPDPEKRRALAAHLRFLGGHGDVNFRDVTALDFDDQTLDAIVSFDVLEHVPDYARAISEFARTLKPNGRCIATFPFNDRAQTLVRARIGATGQIEHIEPPEFHGDPISGGVLCFYHFGWDVLDAFRDAGFRKVEMLMPFSLAQGIPYGMWTLVAER